MKDEQIVGRALAEVLPQTNRYWFQTPHLLRLNLILLIPLLSSSVAGYDGKSTNIIISCITESFRVIDERSAIFEAVARLLWQPCRSPSRLDQCCSIDRISRGTPFCWCFIGQVWKTRGTSQRSSGGYRCDNHPSYCDHACTIRGITLRSRRRGHVCCAALTNAHCRTCIPYSQRQIYLCFLDNVLPGGHSCSLDDVWNRTTARQLELEDTNNSSGRISPHSARLLLGSAGVS